MSENLQADRFRKARHDTIAVLKDIRGQQPDSCSYISLTAYRGEMIERICLALREALNELRKRH